MREEREVNCDDFPALLAATAWQAGDAKNRTVIVNHICDDPLQHVIQMERASGA